MNINFYMPTKVIMAKNCIEENAFIFKEYGKTALIVTGTSSAKENGALQDVENALFSQGIQYYLFDKVKANPTVAGVFEGADYARLIKADFVIGIGGGSPMDAAKAIALLTRQSLQEEEIFTASFVSQALPIILIPTTAGTGSEVTPYSILTNVKSQTKTSISNPLLFPKVALLDAKYMKTLPMATTIHTSLDALSHAIEGMLTVRVTEISDSLAMMSLKMLAPCIKLLSLEQNGADISMEVREKLLYGSTLAGMVITHTGTTAVHSMGYPLTYFRNLDHGRANGLLLPSFIRFVMKDNPESVNKILTAMELNSIDEFEDLFIKLLGVREVVTKEEIELFSSIAAQSKNVRNSRIVPTKDDIVHMYTRSLSLI